MSTNQFGQLFPEDRFVGAGFRESYVRRIRDGFMRRYFSGPNILDIGYQGSDPRAVPITEWAIGIGRDYPGYDGTRLPFPDESQDTIVASHVLEHIPNHREVLREWYRVLRIGGFLVLMLPHQHLFEKRPDIPSRWNGDHRRFYTPARLLAEIEEALPINGYRIRHLADNDEGYVYDAEMSDPPRGCFEIELVLQKRTPPAWSSSLAYSGIIRSMLGCIDDLIVRTVSGALKGIPAAQLFRETIGGTRYFTPWHRLLDKFVYQGVGGQGVDGSGGRRVSSNELMKAVRPLLDCVTIDVAAYLRLYPQLAALEDPAGHWRSIGYFEGRAIHEGIFHEHTDLEEEDQVR